MKCPSCGKEIPDDSEICPYCTASIKHRVRVKSIYVAALVLLIIGASYGVLAYYGSEIPVTKIRDLGLKDNYNFIRIKGVVDGYPWVYENEYQVTSFRFKVNDGTGSITVKLYSGAIERMMALGNVPEMGDTVDIKGTYLYSSNSIVVNNPEYMVVEKGDYREISLDELSSAPPWAFTQGEKVVVRGNITGVSGYSFGFICPMDEKVDILIPRAFYSLKILNLSDMGSSVISLYGSLEFYRPIQPSPSYQVVDLPYLLNHTEEFNGTQIRITWAQVLFKDEDSRTIEVESNGSRINVYVRRGVRYYDPGEYVEIQGKFIKYNGSWEISVSDSYDYVSEPRWEVIAGTKYDVVERKEYSDNPNLELFSLREIRGKVVDYTMFTSSALITLWNENGTYTVYVESNTMASGIDYGMEVLVKGIVTEYQGRYELKLRPFTEDSLEVVG